MEQREVNAMLTIQSLINFRCMRCVMIQRCTNYIQLLYVLSIFTTEALFGGIES